MAESPPQPDSTQSALEIPRPKAEELSASAKDGLSSKEYAGYAAGTLDKKAMWDWRLHFGLKIGLFVFVVAMNIWWGCEVDRMLWHSGMVGSTFHLGDVVLAALVSGYMVNLIALLAVIARGVYPSVGLFK